MEPVSPALAGESFATEPPGKSPQHSLWCKNITKPGDARSFSVLINFDLWCISVKEKLPVGGPGSTSRGLGWFANNRSRPGLGWRMLRALGMAQREAGGIQEQLWAVFVLSLLASCMAKSGQSGHKVWSCDLGVWDDVWHSLRSVPLGSEGRWQTLPSSKSAASWKTCLFVKWCLKFRLELFKIPANQKCLSCVFGMMEVFQSCTEHKIDSLLWSWQGIFWIN